MGKVVNAAPPRSQIGRVALFHLKRFGLRNLFLLVIALVAVGLALYPAWLTAAGLPPLLLVSLPGLALWALGTCKTSRSRRESRMKRRHLPAVTHS